MTPIEYIDFMAHHIRMKAAGYREMEPPYELSYLADTLEKSAAYFRQEDPSLPPPEKYPDPSSYYEGGESGRQMLCMPSSFIGR